jgi:hypothetical protein
MSPRTAERRAPVGKPPFDPRALPWGWIAAAAVVLVSLVAVQQLFAGPTYVTVTIENPTSYALVVEASGGGHDGWVSVAIAGQHATTVAQEVLDQGPTWTFRFSSQGQSGGTLTVTRAQLASMGWRLQVPATVQKQLERRGAPPTP